MCIYIEPYSSVVHASTGKFFGCAAEIKIKQPVYFQLYVNLLMAYLC